MTRRRQRRPTLAAPEPMRGVLDRASQGSGQAVRPTLSQATWLAAVGPRIAERAQPIEVDRDILVVRVATSVWASELSLLATPILERLNAGGLALRALRCRVGPVEVKVQATSLRPTRAVPAPAPLPTPLVTLLDQVEDLELRGVIASAASANLAWQGYVAGSAASAAGVTNGMSRAARVPRYAETGSDPQGQTSGGAAGAARRRP